MSIADQIQAVAHVATVFGVIGILVAAKRARHEQSKSAGSRR
jgi:hypothetical protein